MGGGTSQSFLDVIPCLPLGKETDVKTREQLQCSESPRDPGGGSRQVRQRLPSGGPVIRGQVGLEELAGHRRGALGTANTSGGGQNPVIDSLGQEPCV